jgi:uncharacterized membrane protein/protein-disulfide isomerase
MPMNEDLKPLPYRYYYIPIFLVCLIGMLVTCYLLQSHYRNYTDMAYASFCAISKAINCDTVSQSPWAVIFGLPVALWGLFGYLLFLVLLLPLRRETHLNLPLWNLLFILGWLYSLISLFLGYISAVKIHSFCIMCVASYGISFALLFQSWLICRRFGISPLFPNLKNAIFLIGSNRKIYGPVITLVALFFMAELFLPHYWKLHATETPLNLTRGITEDGHPWIGAEKPMLTIEEFSDYQCFQCKKMHFFLRKLVQAYPNKIRLVHRHFPMDHHYNPLVTEKFHSGAGKMSIIALYALKKGQFWPVNDLLFEIASQKKDFNTRTIAEFMGIPVGELSAALNDKYFRLKLKHDIATGIDHGITGTPGFVIDGQLYLGTIPKRVLQKIDNQK